MADETKEGRAQSAPVSDVRASAMADMLNVADSLRLLQQQAAQEAMKLPAKRLDDASPEGGATPYVLRKGPDGEKVKINAFGDEVDENGKLTKAGEESAAARAMAGLR